MASLGQLVAGIAHEINNPVSYIYANIKCLDDYIKKLRNLLNEYENLNSISNDEKIKIIEIKLEIDYDFLMKDIDSLIRSCEEGAQRVKNIVADLRSFSRVDEAELKEVDIHIGIENTLEFFLEQYQDKLVVHKKYGDIPKLKCYAGQLNQVFMNLLINAAQTIEERNKMENRNKGNIWIKTEMVISDEKLVMKNDGLVIRNAERRMLNSEFHIPNSAFIRVSIKDDGVGIPVDKHDKIFDPFFTTRPVGKGTGLGLSISYSIIQRHKGKLFFNTEIGKGTEFIIELPLL
jgi:signal transduction histidine kinase